MTWRERWNGYGLLFLIVLCCLAGAGLFAVLLAFLVGRR